MKICFPEQADDSLYYTRYLQLAGGEDLIVNWKIFPALPLT